MKESELDITNAELLKQVVDSIKNECEQIRKELKKELYSENKKIIEKIDNCYRNINELDKKIKHIDNRCKYLDRNSRKNNILIFGLQIPENSDLVKVTLEKIKELTDIDLSLNDINNLHTIRVGNKTVIKIIFVSYLKKELLLKNGYRLKGTNISFAEDLCYEDRQERKFLRKHLQVARSKNYFAKIRGQKLVVNNEVYSIDQLKNFELEEVSNGIDTNTPLSPIHYVKPSSAPATPSVSETYFEDSLQIFSLNTPQSTKEDIYQNKRERTEITGKEKTTEITTNKIDDKIDYHTRSLVQEKDNTKRIASEKNVVGRKNQEPAIDKKTEENKKRINLPKERSNSASSYSSRVITRQQMNNK